MRPQLSTPRRAAQGDAARTSTVVESLSLPAALLAVSETVFAPGELKLVEYDEPLPEPPSLSLQEKVSIQPPATVAPAWAFTAQLTLWSTTTGDVQAILIIGFFVVGMASTVVEALSLPAELRAVSETVFAPVEKN